VCKTGALPTELYALQKEVQILRETIIFSQVFLKKSGFHRGKNE
jgi:hypothetical protein